jgi:hypothetical protein
VNINCSYYCEVTTAKVVLGGVMISVLAIESKVRGFKSGRERRILRPIKIRSTPSFGGEVKPSVPCRKIFAACQRTIRSMNKDTLLGQINHFIRQFLLLCNKVTVGRIARVLVEESVFHCHIIPPLFSTLIYNMGDKQLARWWPKFRDKVSPHRHDDDNHHLLPWNRILLKKTTLVQEIPRLLWYRS